MKYLINLVLWAAMGAVLAISGYPCTTWQYWAINACTICITINVALW